MTTGLTVQAGDVANLVSEPIFEQQQLSQILWPVWRALTREFQIGRLMRHLALSKSGWGVYEVDVVSTLKATPMSLAAKPILAGQTDQVLRALRGIARINAKRNDSIWKMAALFYVSGPTSLILAGFQIAPSLTRMVLSEGGIGFVVIFFGLLFSLLHYYSINWRAAQIEALIELEMVERGLDVAG